MHPSQRGTSISLPVIQSDTREAHHARKIRPSRNGKRRAIVLAAVQGLMIAHIVLWLLSRKYGWFGGGHTTTPIEPSESMAFAKDGVINAGLIFFSVALLSTLILGRWFCGWGCHIVMLQDFCGWMMKKVGVRPKPFRSRLLIYVPLLLAIYMFILPAVHRVALIPLDASLAKSLGDHNWLVIGVREVSGFLGFPLPLPNMPAWSARWHLTTTEFWRTFPGAMIAIPFLFVCGFAIVYFLGAKGFCTYGCPYGGFFAPLDRFAPGRILVTDACEGCGHCTAVCTSNVRVHEEVREYGMVVDPGCMKCLDCVSVCPNEALHFGFARPAVLKGSARNEAPQRRYDLTLGEECVFAGVFALTFFSVRGVYGLVPMLMAAGLAGCVTFVVWKCWRLLREPNVVFHHFQLKLKGRWKLAGLVFALLTAITFALVLHCGMINLFKMLGDRQFARVDVNPAEVSAGHLASVDESDREHARMALFWYDRIVSIPSGGFALTSLAQDDIDGLRARMHCALNEFDQAETILRDGFAQRENETTTAALGRFLSDRPEAAKKQEALALYERVLPLHPEYGFILDDYEPWAMSLGRAAQVMSIHRERLRLDPRNVRSIRSISLMLLQSGQLDEGLAMVGKWVEIEPHNPDARRFRSLALADAGQMDVAISEMRRALELAPENDVVRELLAQMLDSSGRAQEGAAVRQGRPTIND